MLLFFTRAEIVKLPNPLPKLAIEAIDTQSDDPLKVSPFPTFLAAVFAFVFAWLVPVFPVPLESAPSCSPRSPQGATRPCIRAPHRRLVLLLRRRSIAVVEVNAGDSADICTHAATSPVAALYRSNSWSSFVTPSATVNRMSVPSAFPALPPFPTVFRFPSVTANSCGTGGTSDPPFRESRGVSAIRTSLRNCAPS